MASKINQQEEVVKQGYLQKRSRKGKWQRRWFTLTSSGTLYYAKDLVAASVDGASTAIDIAGVTSVKRNPGSTDISLLFGVCPADRYQLRTDSTVDANAWCDCLLEFVGCVDDESEDDESEEDVARVTLDRVCKEFAHAVATLSSVEIVQALDRHGCYMGIEDDDEEVATQQDKCDVNAMSLRELKKVLDEHGTDYSKCIEKSELIEHVSVVRKIDAFRVSENARRRFYEQAELDDDEEEDLCCQVVEMFSAMLGTCTDDLQRNQQHLLLLDILPLIGHLGGGCVPLSLGSCGEKERAIIEGEIRRLFHFRRRAGSPAWSSRATTGRSS